jgi:SpoVK/Ycf46/Vps4 family AAA+-type ATPase
VGRRPLAGARRGAHARQRHAARLIDTIRLAEIACERATILERYKPDWPPVQPRRGTQPPEKSWAKVFEPDEIIKPCERLLTKIIRPISDQMRAGHFFLRPQKNGVSFILYGPPGSGKTFVVSRFAAALGWPLINLNPGYFIKKGLELIEAIAGEIFADLMKLDHAVVFFDECDELFRDRGETEGGRNILSFATASMLPKLQKLHDNRKALFILGTNLVHNIDLAIRRPGRFDDILLFDRPDQAARLKIAKQTFADEKNVTVAKLNHRAGSCSIQA